MIQFEQDLKSCIRDEASVGKPYDIVVRNVKKRNHRYNDYLVNKTIDQMVRENDLTKHDHYLADPARRAFWESRHNFRVWIRRTVKTVEFILDWV